jgi:hypothetical protein
MAPNDVRGVLKREPFEPFRMCLSDGLSYEVRHPELVWVGLSSLMLGFPAQPDSPFYERAIKIALRHIVRLEPLEGHAKGSANGPPPG